MSKRKSREKKGNPPITYVDDKSIQGERTGEFIKKSVRPNILKDVLELRDQGKTNDEIHTFGCEKYSFRDDNPWEYRYFTYIKEPEILKMLLTPIFEI